MCKPLLKSEIRLRKLAMSDAKSMLEWMQTPDIYEKMQYDPAKQSIETCCHFIEKSWDDKCNLHYAITDQKQTYLGTVSLKNIDRDNKHAEFAIALHPIAIGKSIGTSALRLIMGVAFEELELNKVYLYVRKDNERAIAFYERNHLELEGCFKEHLKIGESYKDIYWYALRKENYMTWKQMF